MYISRDNKYLNVSANKLHTKTKTKGVFFTQVIIKYTWYVTNDIHLL